MAQTVIFSFIVVLAGCSGGRKIKRTVFFKEQEARLSDVPIPLDAKSYGQSIDTMQEKIGMLMRFKTSYGYDQLQTFYQQEMEGYGWKITAVARSDEALYHCCKPTRWCSIFIRPIGRYCVVSIFVGS